MNRNKHVKNLKIYNKKHKSFYNLKYKWFFGFFNYRGKIYINDSVIELLTILVRDINIHDNIKKEELYDFIKDNVELIELQRDTKIKKITVNKISNEIYKLSQNKKEFFKFRGDLLEYLTVYILKTNKNSLYHEPVFYHKRKNLITKNFKGKDCLVDVVEYNQRDYNINFFECKANYNNAVRSKQFRKKLDYMDYVESKLTKYKNNDEEYIKVEKNILSIVDPIKPLPKGYQNYSVKNLISIMVS
ncbi:hypothetical protein ACTWP4_18550 [Gracilibacillus sp. D59]|uniref:hypothetical protein n=1 Tax=Gracilibacillus sp. D59 TaxID=3457434 RepID=UPI003FCDFEE9